MIDEFADFLGTYLAGYQYPFRVSYGPDVLPAVDFTTRIVVERDPAGDGYLPSRGLRRNPRRVAEKRIGGRVWIYAKETRKGATLAEHQRLMDQLADGVFCAFREFALRRVKVVGEILESRPATESDRPELRGIATANAPGALYLMRVRLPRGVEVRKFDGSGLPECNTSATSNVVNVTRESPTGDTEIVEI